MVLIIGVFLIIAFIEGVILALSLFKKEDAIGNILSENEVAKYASMVIEECKDSKYHPSCYDREIPKLMDKITMEDAFRVTKVIQTKDSQYNYCHVLGHKLSGRETQKDPSKWKDVIARCPTTMCNNGCLHGPLLEIFNSESLTDSQIEKLLPEMKTICEPRGKWNPVPVEISMCYHGIGHLAMFMTNADINKSLSICEEVAVRPSGESRVQTCTQGVFMQVFQPLEPEDYALVKKLTPKKENIDSFCNSYNKKYIGTCHAESWALFREEIKSPQGLIKFCSYSEDAFERRRCISAGMSFLTVYFMVNQKNINALYDFCTTLPESEMSWCFADAAIRMINISPNYANEAISICKIAKDAGFEDYCFEKLYPMGTFGFKPISSEFNDFCTNLPQPWQEKCFKKEQPSNNTL